VSRLAVAEQQVLDENAGLEELSERLDQIRQGVTSNANDDLLAQLRQSALQVQRQADVLVTRVPPMCSAWTTSSTCSARRCRKRPSLTRQRKQLEREKNALVAEQKDTTALAQSARDLSTQIVNLRRSLFNSQITSRAASPLSPAFWSSLIRPTDDDVARLRDLRARPPMPWPARSAPSTAGCSSAPWWPPCWSGPWCAGCSSGCWPTPWCAGCP
jgi:small-conductance mechanosensitive channel